MAAINTKFSLTNEQEELAEWARTAFESLVKPTQVMISRIVNNKSYREMNSQKDFQSKRDRDVKDRDLEETLIGRVLQMQVNSIRISTDLLQQKGKELANQKGLKEDELWFSNG
ncbi:hypothetical protein BGZ46_001378 [Entomortierella lignicola]|nr:hypothetical protein BGZ46_001378 [Entomortierella lignicola]